MHSKPNLVKNKQLWIILLIVFVNILGFGIILPLLPYYVETLGAGALTIGFVTAAYSLFQIISAPILGELSDKIGRRPVLLISIAGTALSFLILGFADSIFLLFVSRIIDGATGGNISTAQAYIADITDKDTRTQGMGMMMASFGLGFISGPALGGVLSVYGYSLPAFVAGFVALVATVLTYFFLPESLKSKNIATANRKLKISIFNYKDFIDALNHPTVGVLLTISFLTMLAFSLMQGTFALFTEHVLNLSARTTGLLFAYLGLLGIIVQLFLVKKVLRVLKESQIILGSIIISALSLVLVAYSQNLAALIFALTMFAVGNGIAAPILTGLISKLTPETEQGNIAGLNLSVGSTARLVGPVAGTVAYSQLGAKSPYFFAVALLLLTFGIGVKKLKTSTA